MWIAGMSESCGRNDATHLNALVVATWSWRKKFGDGRSGGYYREPDLRELTDDMMGDSSVVFPAFELIFSGEKPGAHRGSRDEYRRRRDLHGARSRLRHPTVDRR